MLPDRPVAYFAPCDMGPRVHRARLTATTVTLSLPISPPVLVGLLSNQNSDRRCRLPFRHGLALSIVCVHHPFHSLGPYSFASDSSCH